MKITKHSEINGETAKALRESLGLQQKEFWPSVGVSPDRGCRYETGETKRIPEPAQRLVFLHYVCGVPTDMAPGEFRKMEGFASPERRLIRQSAQALNFIEQSQALLVQAKAALATQ